MLIKEVGYKINFIDENDVFVGYDLSQSCCESAGWFITYEKKDSTYSSTDDVYYEGLQEGLDVYGYVFDPSFTESINGGNFDEGGMVIFRLTYGVHNEIFLHLYNCHNGYYGHGFETNLPCGDGCL